MSTNLHHALAGGCSDGRWRCSGWSPCLVPPVSRLLGDAGIVRDRAKIEATIHNAGRVLELDRPLDELLWSFAPAAHTRPATLADVPATSPESVAMAKELKRRGLRFVGPTTCYALMQAAGLVDDHVATCWRAAAV